MPNQLFAQAAFRHIPSGHITPTGQHHDISLLEPDANVDEYEDGFIGHNGQFYTREQATEAMRLTAPVQSESLFMPEIVKSLKDYTFEGPTLEGTQYRVTARDASGKHVGALTFASKAGTNPSKKDFGLHAIGQADVHPAHRKQGLYGHMLNLSAMFVRNHLKSKGLWSEGELRSEAATGAWLRLLKQKKAKKLSSLSPEAPDFFMNEKGKITNIGSSDPDKVEHEFIILFRQWIASRQFKKSEGELFSLNHSNLTTGINAGDHEVAVGMSGIVPESISEFRAASFMAGGKHTTPEKLRSAMLLWDHDLEMAALVAYDIPRTEENRTILRVIAQMQSLQKSDVDVAVIPRLVVPVLPDGQEFSNAIRRAIAAGAVQHVSLGGKHSSGTAIAVDPNNQKKYLLKPGSGPLSPSAGVREQPANQSRREVAFSKIAKIIGLGDFVAEAELLLVDGKEVAAMELVPSNYKDLNKLRKNKDFNLQRALEPYRKDGTLFKWAILDMILGNPDRHAGNVMATLDGKFYLIDHGTSFAGFAFSPAEDPKSFIPVYLRAWYNGNFHLLDPQDRFDKMPKPDTRTIEGIGYWIEHISEGKLIEIMNSYGIMHDPIITRLMELKNASAEDKIEMLLDFWSGILIDEAQ